MKTIIICIIFLGTTGTTISQHLDSAHQLSPEKYFKKGREQKTAASVLTVAGSVGLIVTLLSNLGNGVKDVGTTLISLGTVEPKHRSYTVPYVLSAACIGGGIALFIASAENNRKGFTVSTHLKTEKAPLIPSLTPIQLSYPCLAVTFKLK